MSWSALPLGLDLLRPNYFFAFYTSQPSVPCWKQILALPIHLLLLLGFVSIGKRYKMRVTQHTTINYTYQSKKTRLGNRTCLCVTKTPITYQFYPNPSSLQHQEWGLIATVFWKVLMSQLGSINDSRCDHWRLDIGRSCEGAGPGYF